MKSLTYCFTFAVALGVNVAAAHEVTAPADYLGHAVGADFKLPDWKQVSGYYRRLADESPCVQLKLVGKTTEGRDFLVAIISSEANLARLDEIQQLAKVIADPRNRSKEERRRAINDGRVILFVTPTMHSTEVAGTQMGMEFAWKLATSDEEPWRSARDNTVVVITPTLNPDGLDHVSHWYRETVHTPYETSPMTKLYQFYTGHDNNRDWAMLTQLETRHLTRLIYREWLPQILWDVHQQGNTKERFFIPPYRDPLNPNLNALTVAGVGVIGNRAILDLTRDGLTGVATGVSYDNWFNGGNRGVPTRHHIMGILTEAASANLASPIYQARSTLKSPLGEGDYAPSHHFLVPWPGGWWRVRDIIDYELAFGRSLLASVNRERKFWLRNAMQAAERSIAQGNEGPRAWLIPNDNLDRSAVRRLVDALLETGVELHTATDAFTADGHSYPTGTIVIRRDQPYGNYVKDLFELQKFPAELKPYDICGWTLPLLLGVRRVEVMQPLEVKLSRLTTVDEAVKSFAGDPRVAGKEKKLLSASDADAWTAVVGDLQKGQSVGFVVREGEAGLFRRGVKDEDGMIVLDKLPRIGVYAPWTGSMDEGWLRWVLDHFKIPFVTVRNETLRAGKLGDVIDVLLIPNVTRTQLNEGREAGSAPADIVGGLAPEGAIAVEEFVREGGKLAAWGGASGWVVDLLRLPLVEVTSEAKAKGFSCPGSVLRGRIETHALTAGLPENIALLFDGGSAWRTATKAEIEKSKSPRVRFKQLLSYAPSHVLLSGKIDKAEVIEGQAAWIAAKYGHGDVHLFGFSPHFRGWTQQTMHLLFRAMFLTSSSAAYDEAGL
jgi:hypothetical protein